jgi:hypothetical protein
MSDQYPTSRRQRYAQSALEGPELPTTAGGPRREFAVPLPITTSTEFAASCPQAIIDTDPEGHGLGVWVLVGSGTDNEHGAYCEYEYAGGIV